MQALMLPVDADELYQPSEVSVVGQVYERNTNRLARLQTRINATHRNYRQTLADLTARQEARRAAELREAAPQAPEAASQLIEKEPASPKWGSFGKSPVSAIP